MTASVQAARAAELERMDFKVLMGVNDAMQARLVEDCAAADILLVGGYGLGATDAVSEPLLSLERIVNTVRTLSAACKLPIWVDGGAGYGDPINVRHTVQQLQRAGATHIQIEDQRFPKQASYHKYIEETVDRDYMLAKIRAAVEAKESGVQIVARTDCNATHGYDEAVSRLNAYLASGADIGLAFPSSADEAQRLTRDVIGPVVYPNSIGNRIQRPILDRSQAKEFGYAYLMETHTMLLASYWAQRRVIEKGLGDLVPDWRPVRLELERTIRLPELYAFEEKYKV
jgi:2-methylisocitrate lyase-like PEP mutase family enzyme